MSRIFPRMGSLNFEIASRSIAGLLFLLVAAGGISGQRSGDLASIRNAVHNGRFERVVATAPGMIGRYREAALPAIASEAGVLYARSLIHLERYNEAGKGLEEALSDAEKSSSAGAIASVHFAKAGLSRLQRDFPDAIRQALKGVRSAPNDPQVKLEYHLAIGRILYSSGYDVAAIVWLEKAEKLSSNLRKSPAHLDVLGHLSFAWASKFSYSRALQYGEKLVRAAEGTEYRYLHRLALFELGYRLRSVGQERKANVLLERGLELALKAEDDYQSCLFLNTLMLFSLYKLEIEAAENRLLLLERIDRNRRFQFEITRNKAVLAGLKGQEQLSEKYFKDLASLKGHSDHIVPFWRLTIAEHKKDWTEVIEHAEALRKLAEDQNFRDDLPGLYFSLAKAHLGLGKQELAIEYARRAAAIVEDDRPLSDAPLSLAILETYHSVYRLLAEMEGNKNDSKDAAALADYMKARVLLDRIENSVIRRSPDLITEVRKRAEHLSTKLVEGSDVREQMAELERSATISSSQQGTEPMPAYGKTGNINAPAGIAIVSYFFTLDGALRAHVIESGAPIRVVKVSLTEKEAESLAETVRTKIRDKVFFKSDGKNIYDNLLAPLSIDADHIVIVPDKALWKIPFHALSHDGKSYLIEHKIVSYSPSVGMLANELKKPAPIRRSIQVFANDSFAGRHLTYVNREAANVARIFSSRPWINATRRQFLDSAGKSEILHFSMHAQADPEEPLDSFLAFRAQGQDSGKISVADLLNVRLEKQSLAFLASCESSNVLNGEGLVSIAWALLGSGSSSVISAQWEANDRSTEIFTQKFYEQYREGKAPAKALQAASIAMIRDKSSKSHEPYFWAAFSLLGDYR